DPIPEYAVRSAADSPEGRGIIRLVARNCWSVARSRRQDGIAPQRDNHRPRSRRHEEPDCLALWTAWREPPGTGDQRPSERAVLASRAASAFLLHAHEDRPDSFAR